MTAARILAGADLASGAISAWGGLNHSLYLVGIGSAVMFIGNLMALFVEK